MSCLIIFTLLVEQLTEVSDNEIRAPFAERLGIIGTVNTDHQTKAAGPARLNPRHSIFDNDRPRRFDAEPPGTLEERIRCRLAGEPELSRYYPIDASLE